MFEWPFSRILVPPSCLTHQWILWIVVAFTCVLFTGVLQSAASEDFSAIHFVGQMHTIGSTHSDLWAIIKSDTKEWIVYRLTTCEADFHEPPVHCMVISEPVPMDTKWPLLGQSIKQAANITDYSSLTINTSVILFKISLDDNIIIMQSSAFQHDSLPQHSEYVGFCFGTNHLVGSVSDGMSDRYEGAWISSSEEDKVYQILEMGTKIQKLHLSDTSIPYEPDDIKIYFNEEKKICNNGTADQPMVLFTSDECKLRMEWTIYKGVHFWGWFYLFDSDRVFIFSDKAIHEPSKVYIIKLDTFFSYVEPPTTTTVATRVNSIVFVEETTEPTTAKAILPSTILIYIVLAGIALLGIGLFIYCNVLPESDNQEGDINKRILMPNNNNSNLKGKRNNNNNRRQHSGKNVSRGLKGPSKNRLSLSKCKIKDSKSKAVSKEKVLAKSSAKSNAKSNAKTNAKSNSKVGVKMCSKNRNKMSISKQTTGKHFTSSKQVYNKLNK